MIAASGFAVSVEAEPEPAAERVEGGDAPAIDSVRLRFNFQDATFEQVLDFFSRRTGLPIIREAPAPNGRMSFVSGQDYAFDEAMTILNLNLAAFDRRLRHDGGFLYLANLKDAARKPTRVAELDALDGLPPDEMVTVTIPLSNATAEQVAERIQPLVGEHGRVTPLPVQNMVLVVETAAQARRIRDIVQAVDAVRPVDSEFKLFPLEHADARAVVEALRGLVGQRIQRIIIDRDGQQRTVEEVDIGGISIQPDRRTNSVIAVGPKSRIDTVAELVALLDRPEGGLGGEHQMMTFALETITADRAAEALNGLFGAVASGRRPTVLPLADVNKVTVVGPAPMLAQAAALIGEIDPTTGGEPRQASAETVAQTLRLSHVEAGRAEQIARRLLTPRQTQALRTAVAPDGRGLIVAGPSRDVDALADLLRGLDVPADVDREVRTLRLDPARAARLLERARELDTLAGDAERDPVTAQLDEDSGSLTLVASRAGLERFERLIRSAGDAVIVERETRRYEPERLRPSVLAEQLARLAKPLLDGPEGVAYRAPEMDAVDDLGVLIVRAQPEQFAILEELIERLDASERVAREFRVVRLTTGDPARTVARAQELYRARAAGVPEGEAGEVEATIDPASGSLLLRGTARGLGMFQEALEASQRLMPPDRTTRLLDISQANAGDIAGPLRELLSEADPIDPARAVPEPTIRVIERTNGLLVTAEEAQHRLIADFVRRLDTIEPATQPPLRMLQLRTADSAAIARMLSEQYSRRPQAERAAKPVDVRADAGTNTLIVSAHADLFDEIRTFVEDLNRGDRDGPARETVLFPLKVARAEAVATAMDRLYAEPPIPMDRFGRPMPWLREPKEVTVSADPSSNSLIIDAPAERIESLRELAAKLDVVQLPPVAELRTYRVTGGDLNAIVRTLTALARQGNLAAPGEPGRQPVQVVVESEPRSGTLIVAGDDTTFARVEEILRDLSAVPVERGLRVFPIASTDAGEVRDLAMTLYEAQVSGVPGAEPIDVTVDQSANALLVVADAEGMARFSRVLEELERGVGPGRDLRMLEVRHAQAVEVVAFLRELSATNRSMTAQGGPEPVFEAVEQTNSILVAARPDQFPIIEELVRSLDAQRSADRPPLRILRLRSTDASNLAQVLRRSYDGRRTEDRTARPVSVEADPSTNTLIVSAHPDLLPEIESIVQSLNDAQAFDASGREIRIFPLRVARAEDLARTIDEMFPQPPVPVDPRTRQARPDLQPPKEVVVRADPATNSLIVDAPAQRLSGFERIVESLDTARLAEDVEVRTYRVARADPAAVARTLNNLARTGALHGTAGASAAAIAITVDVEPASRSVVVSGPVGIFGAVDRVLTELDEKPSGDAGVVRLYALRHARAERIAPLLDRVLSERLRERRELGEIDPQRTVESLLDVSADRGSNTLIISAPEAIQAIATELIEALDTDGPGAASATVRVVPLSFVSGQDVARALTSAVAGMDLPAGGPVSVVAAGAGAVLVTGLPSDVEAVTALVEPLDRPPSDAQTPAVESFTLEHARATELAPSLERLLLDDDPRQAQWWQRQNPGQMPAVRVEADERTNTVIVSAPSAKLALAKAVVETLDKPAGAGGRSFASYTPANADASNLAETVSRVLAATAGEGRRVELVAQSSINAVVAIGPEGRLGEALRLLAEFDERTPSMPAVTLRVFELSHASASAVAGTVQQVLSDRASWPKSLQAAVRAGLNVQAPRVNADTEGNRLLVSAPSELAARAAELIATLDEPASGSVRESRVFTLREGSAAGVAEAVRAALTGSARPGDPRPTVTPEPGSNAVVVAGTPEQVAKAAELVREMDRASSPDGVAVRTLVLKHARAEALAPVVQRVLSKERTVDTLPAWARVGYIERFGDDSAGSVRVEAEPRLNAIVVSGPAGVLELAEQVVAELDAPEGGPDGSGGPRSVRVLTLKNADAGELASTIAAVFEDDAGGVRPPVVRVDSASNALIVRADRAQMEEVERLVSQLDEATLTSSRQMRAVRIDRSRADAGQLAEQLRRLMEQRGGVRVEVIGAEELMERGARPERDERGSRVPSGRERHVLPGAVPSSWMEALLGLSVASVEDDDGDDEADVTIAVDKATNTLLVIGSPRATERVAALARELESQMPAEPVAVRLVGLPSGADARAIAGIVQQTAGRIGRASDANPGGFTGAVAVQPDPEQAGLIVWANDADFESLRGLIAALAQPGAAESVTVKIYRLRNVRADRALASVRDLLSAQPVGRQARRVRGLDVAFANEDGEVVRGVIDPSTVSISLDPSRTALIVSAPDATMRVIDRFVELIDQSSGGEQAAIKRYTLEHAGAGEMSRTMQRLFDAQRDASQGERPPRAIFVPDERTNTLLLTATEAQHAQAIDLIAAADTATTDADTVLEVIQVREASAQGVARVIQEVVIGRDEARRAKIAISTPESGNLLVVRAPEGELEEIRRVVADVDISGASGLPVRTVKLERADAAQVASTLRAFFQDRERAAAGRRGGRAAAGVAITGDRRSGTLVIAASDEDFEQLSAMAATFDAPAEARQLQFKIIGLEHARVSELLPTVQSFTNELQYERQWGNRERAAGGIEQDTVFVQSNEALNALVLIGQGESFGTIEAIIRELDRKPSDLNQQVVRAVRVDAADLDALRNVIQRALSDPNWPWWRGEDPNSVKIEVDRRRRLLVLIGPPQRVEQAAGFIDELATAAEREGVTFTSITLRHARADRAANSLRRFFAERAQAEGLAADLISVVGSLDGNLLLVSGAEEEVALLREMVAQIDQPELGQDRRVEVYLLRHALANETAATLRAMFPSTGSAEERVIVTPQGSSATLVVSAPETVLPRVEALISQLDAPPGEGASSMVTVSLSSARAQEVATALRSALPETVKVRITPVPRSNTILLTGQAESIELVMAQIERLDTEPVRSLTEFRRIPLQNAMADDVVFTLGQMLRGRPRAQGTPEPRVESTLQGNTLLLSAAADEIAEIAAIVAQLDVEDGTDRRTEFVKLEFADSEQAARALRVFYGRMAPEAATPAARDVTIVPDPASRSLVISAAEQEWASIRALLSTLDNELYDTSQQLVVIPLRHADASSVARALNEGLRAPLEEQFRQEQLRVERELRARGGRDQGLLPPPVLVDASGTPTVSAEVQTNALVVFAGREDLSRIRRIVEQLDVPEVVRLREPTIISVSGMRASQLAVRVRELFVQGRPGMNARSPVIVGDDATRTLIVRADESELAQIRALAESLQRVGGDTAVRTRVVRLERTPAARLRDTLVRTFSAEADRVGSPLAIEVDRGTNSLVIAASSELFEQVERVARELDGAVAAAPGEGGAPGGAMLGPGQGVFIIDVEHNDPATVRQLLEQMGVTQPQPADRPGVVAEPVRIVPLVSRRALAIVANPADGTSLTALVRAIDAEPAGAGQEMAVVPLRLASADGVVRTLREMLNADGSGQGASPSRALAEQVRRIQLLASGAKDPEVSLDLSTPIRLIPDAQTNSVAIASSAANVRAVSAVIHMLDTLPIGDAVVVRIFPLEQAAAERVRGVVLELFRTGDALRRVPGTNRQGLPTTTTGRALAGEIAVSIDERTNALVVAGREEAVALVEVLVKDLDSASSARWVEPTLIQLEHASAETLARTLREVLVGGLADTPETRALRRQVGRLRAVRSSVKGEEPAALSRVIESDLFVPMSGLTIVPESDLNALIVVGTPNNIAVVRELAEMLDVEQAFAGNRVRVYPLRHAAAGRAAEIVRDVFRQRDTAGALRPEDRLVITADGRTNALIASTSPRSFEVIESLIETLDQADANYSVKLHVVQVPDGDVRTLAPKIASLMRDRIEGARRAGGVSSPADTFSVEAVESSNSLVIAASDENLAIVRELIEALSGDALAFGQDEQTELVQLTAGSADEVARAVQDLYVTPENRKRGAGSVTVVANERLNALIVSGTSADVEAVRRLAGQFDQTRSASVQEVRRIELRNANALEVVNMLQQILSGRAVDGRTSAQATRLRFVRQRLAEGIEDARGLPPTEAEIDAQIRSQVRVSPELRTNSVVVAAPPDILTFIAAIVSDLDTTDAGERRIRTFRLTNADARQMAEVLRDLFNLRRQGDRYVLIPTRRGLDAEMSEGLAPGGANGAGLEGGEGLFGFGTSLTAVPDDRQELSITIDPRTNTLLVSGTQEYLELVAAVVDELDTIEAAERERLVYHLKNAKAAEIEQTLTRYFSGEAERLRATLGPEVAGSVLRRLEQEVTVVGDEKSNMLVVSASPRYIETVAAIIDELDASPPQVMIQVLLAEVTLDSSREWGLDVTGGPIGGDDYIFGALSAGATVATALGVPNLTVESADFSLLVRALEAQGKLEVLSRPQVTVKNNERARIQVGEDVAIVSNIDRFESGLTRANVERRDVGIILEVTPTINPNGYVQINIQPEISTVSARTTQISDDFESPIITTRQVDTTVTIRDGQTIVIGGLIQTQMEERRTKTPLLGDLPFVGNLFRSTKAAKIKTELLVILTPRIIPGEGSEADRLVERLTAAAIDQVENPVAVRRALEESPVYRTLKELGIDVEEAVREDLDKGMIKPEGLRIRRNRSFE
ncbi:MAG: hypothetical protein EA378_05260 [Phycisphaerales bacterium]|nr:MAG: hypothetical protein EA378_05260 [Phycisphaerales bacterium]